MQAVHKKFIHDLMAELLGLPPSRLVWSGENGVRPLLPHATIRIYNDAPAAAEAITPSGTPGVLRVRIPYECRVEIQYFGRFDSDPCEILAGMVHKLRFDSVADRCFSQGVAFFGHDGIGDISTVLDDLAYERRAAVDLQVRYDRSDDDHVGYIDTVNMENKITGEIANGEIPGNVTIGGSNGKY